MKVAWVTVQFPMPSETFASNDVRTLREDGIEVKVYTLRPPRPDRDELLGQRNLLDLDLDHNSVASSRRGLRAALSRPRLLTEVLGWLAGSSSAKPQQLAHVMAVLPRAFAIFEEIGKWQPDVVHMAWGHYPALVGYLVQNAMPHVATSISLGAYDLAKEFGGSVRVAQRANLVRTNARCNVPHIAAFCGLPAERVRVVYNGIDLARIRALSAGVERVPFRIAIASRLVEGKRIDEALRILKQVRENWPEASLTVMGDGPERGRLQALARSLGVEDAVEFLGHVDHQRVFREMARAHVGLMTSVSASERIPNAVKEAMACGCAVVTTDTPGITELVEHGQNGFIYAQEEPRQAVEAIESVFAGRVDLTALAESALHRIESRFDLAKTARQYKGLWREAVADRTDRGPAAGTVIFD